MVAGFQPLERDRQTEADGNRRPVVPHIHVELESGGLPRFSDLTPPPIVLVSITGSSPVFGHCIHTKH
jgi:hypothetical protein